MMKKLHDIDIRELSSVIKALRLCIVLKLSRTRVASIPAYVSARDSARRETCSCQQLPKSEDLNKSWPKYTFELLWLSARYI